MEQLNQWNGWTSETVDFAHAFPRTPRAHLRNPDNGTAQKQIELKK